MPECHNHKWYLEQQTLEEEFSGKFEGMVFLKVLCLVLCLDLIWGLDVQVDLLSVADFQIVGPHNSICD